MRHSKTNYQHYLPARIAFNIGTTHFYKGKESDNVLLMSDYMIFFSDTGEINPQLNDE